MQERVKRDEDEAGEAGIKGATGSKDQRALGRQVMGRDEWTGARPLVKY